MLLFIVLRINRSPVHVVCALFVSFVLILS